MSVWNDEKSLVSIIVLFSIFTLIVLSPAVGTPLLAFGLIYLVLINSGGDRVFQFSRGKYRKEKSIAIIGVALVCFLFAGGLAVSMVGNLPFSLFSSLQLLSDQAIIPLTIESQPIQILIWGIIIPILETLFFLGIVGKLLSNKLGVRKFDPQNLNTWIVIITVGAVASMFHIVSQFMMEQALITDWIFFSVSMGLVLWRQELKDASILHIILNVVTLGIAGGWFMGVI